MKQCDNGILTMILYDFIHGYQPFNHNDPPDWVVSNLKDVYLPTTEYFKTGAIRRMVEIQGWTIEAWLKSPPPIPDLAKRVLENLKVAHDKGFISIGGSAYAHPLMPLLSETLLQTQIKIDVDIISKNIAPPEWFFFPEGAVNGKSLEILHTLYPDLVSLIPDSALKKKSHSAFVKFNHPQGHVCKVAVFDTLLKDIFMNAHHFEARPPYITERIIWDKAKTVTTSYGSLREVLQSLAPQASFHILVRDWENCGSRRGLSPLSAQAAEAKTLEGNTSDVYQAESAHTSDVKVQAKKEIKAFIEGRGQLDFKTLRDVNFKGVGFINLSDILPTSWEPMATLSEPYPFWQPSERGGKIASLWRQLLHHADSAAQGVIREGELGADQIAEFLPAFISDFPWHFFAQSQSHPDPGFSEKLLKQVIEPAVENLILKQTQMVYTVEKEELRKIISELKQEVWDYTVSEAVG